MDPFATAKERLKKKTKLVAWFCSHKETHGMRQEYFTQLSNHIQVDIYGSCGNNLTCPFMSHECNVMLDSYKFYVSAENSLCPDYVTEKFYRALGRDVVPIVYGGADYSQYAPPYLPIANIRNTHLPIICCCCTTTTRCTCAISSGKGTGKFKVCRQTVFAIFVRS